MLSVCSTDGTVKFLNLEKLGKLVSIKEMGEVCEKLYGIRPRIYSDSPTNGASPKKRARIIDDVDEWIEAANAEVPKMNGHVENRVLTTTVNGTNHTTMNGTVNVESQKSQSTSTSQNVQMEFRTKSGKRKIQPIFLGPLCETEPTTSRLFFIEK